MKRSKNREGLFRVVLVVIIVAIFAVQNSDAPPVDDKIPPMEI